MSSSATTVRLTRKQNPKYVRQHAVSCLPRVVLAGEALDEFTSNWIRTQSCSTFGYAGLGGNQFILASQIGQAAATLSGKILRRPFRPAWEGNNTWAI